MIDLDAARDAIRADVADVDATFYPAAVSELFAVPAVIVGIPEVEFDVEACTDLVRLPVGVVVARDGTNDAASQTSVEALMRAVSDRLRASVQSGRLYDLCSVASLARADFELIGVQGATYPAFTLQLDLYG